MKPKKKPKKGVPKHALPKLPKGKSDLAKKFEARELKKSSLSKKFEEKIGAARHALLYQ